MPFYMSLKLRYNYMLQANTALYMKFPSVYMSHSLYIFLICLQAFRIVGDTTSCQSFHGCAQVLKASPQWQLHTCWCVDLQQSYFVRARDDQSRFNNPPLHLSHMLHVICEKYPSSFPIKLTSVFTYKQTQKSLLTVPCFVYNPII